MGRKTKPSLQKVRYIELRWKLLGYKCMYYCPDKVHPSRHKELVIPDIEYDSLEQEMLKLREDLKLVDKEPWHVGFPSGLPCGELVLSKLGTEKK